MPGRAAIQPNNAASAAGDYVERVQVLDSGGTIVSGTTGTPADGFANPGAIPEHMAFLEAFNGVTWDRVRTAPGADASNGLGVLASVSMAYDANAGLYKIQRMASADGVDPNTGSPRVGPMLFNGSTHDRQRTPNVFKSFASTAITAGVGATIWTPGAGKKFRLMGWLISTSVAGQLIFGDNAVATIITRSEAVVAAAASKLGAGDLGNGYLSAAANNVLKIDGPTGNVAGMVWGTEE